MASWNFVDLFNSVVLQRIEGKLDVLMADVKIAQETLDQFATDINDAVTAVSDELAKLVADASNPLTDADVTALQGAVDNLKNLEPPQVNPL